MMNWYHARKERRALRCVLRISNWLIRRQADAEGRGRVVWGTLLALHNRNAITKLELQILYWWYEWPRFNLQEVAESRMIPNALREQICAVSTYYKSLIANGRVCLCFLVLTCALTLASQLWGGVYLKLALASLSLLGT